MAYGQAAMLISLGAKGYRALQPTSSSLAEMFGTYGKVKEVYAAYESGTRVIVSYHEDSSAQAALKELDGVHVLILEAVHFTFAILHNHLASGGNEPIQLSPSIGFSKKKLGNKLLQPRRHKEAAEHYTAAISKSSKWCHSVAICFCNHEAAYQAHGQIGGAAVSKAPLRTSRADVKAYEMRKRKSRCVAMLTSEHVLLKFCDGLSISEQLEKAIEGKSRSTLR